MAPQQQQPEDAANYDLTKYWKVEAHGTTAMFLIANLIKRKTGDHPQGVLLMPHPEGGDRLIYWLLRERFTAADLARMSGVDEDVIKAKNQLRMVTGDPDPALPKPTVNYFGEA